MITPKVAVLFLLAVLCSGTGCKKSVDGRALIDEYLKAHGTRNIQKLLEMHTEDSEFVFPDGLTIRGKQALRKLFQWDSVLQSHLTMGEIRQNGDTLLIDSVSEANLFFKALGVERVQYQPGTRFVLRKGRIAGTYLVPITAENLSRLQKNFQTFMEWLNATNPQIVERLLPGGKFVHDAASAQQWLKMLDEWQQSLQE